MLDKIIHFSIHNKLVIGMLTLALVIWGVYNLTRLPIDAVPDITNNQVQVITASPSLAAQEVERLITFPIEVNVRNIPGVTEVRSISRFGLSVVTIVFRDQTDIYWARQQVSERLRTAAEQIPKGVGSPELAPVTTGLGEIYQYVIRPKPGYEKKYPPAELRSIQDWIVRRQLLGTEGVADVSSFGGFLKQYEIAIDPDRLRNLGISVDEIFTALQDNNQNTGGAYIDRQPAAYFIRSEGLIGSLDDISKIAIRQNPEGLPIQVRDVAKVQFGSAVRYGAMTYNGQGEVVGAIVLMLKGENSSQVIKNVKQRMEQIQKSLPEGVQIEAFLDRTKLVNKAIGTVSKNLIEGALIVIFVLVLLLGNWRAGLVVASVIPLSMLFAVSLMNVFGVSGNLMSLGAIDFGLIVDGAVIIVEATLHHIAGRKFTARLTQAEMDKEVHDSASKIRNSAAFGEIIILIVYLPILALVGVEGKMFRPMAQVVSFAILGAFILSLTYVPMASALFLSRNAVHKVTFSDRLMAFFYRGYRPLLNFTLRRGGAVVAATLVLLGAALLVFSRLGGEFIPQLDEGDFAVDFRVMTGSSLSQTRDQTLKAETILKKQFPEVIKVVGKIGSGEIPTDPMPIEAADLMVVLKEKDQWTSAKTMEQLAGKMNEALQAIPGVEMSFQQPIQMRFNELMTGVKQDVAVKIFGEDMDVLAESAQKIGAIVRSVAGAEDVYVEPVKGLPQVVVTFDRDKLARHGISIADANRTLNTAFAGSSAGLVYEGEKRYDLVVRLDKPSRESVEDVANLYITTRRGEQVPLSQLADVSLRLGANQVQREDAQRRIIVAFNVRGRDVESIVAELQQKIDARVKLPPGYFLTYGGQFQNLQEAKDRLGIAVPAALFLILALLFFTFRSVRQSLLIFTAVPLSAVGGVLALWLRGMPFSISAGVGFIALFGVSVLNGIVLIAEFNFLRRQGMTDLAEVIRQGTHTRFRPVLMTALVASLGFLPMALSGGAGAEVQKPLATVVIGGLVSATLLTLLVIPVLYGMLERRFGRTLPPVPVVATALLLLVSAGSFAQNQPSRTPGEPHGTLSESQAVEAALQNNLSVKAGTYQIDLRRNLRKTSSDIGKTNLTWMGGQYNSVNFDNNFTLTQNIPFPSAFARRSALLGAELRGSQLALEVTRNELVYEVKRAYEQLVFVQATRRLLEQQDSVLTLFVRAARLRLQTGESTLLEQSAAESQSLEIKVLLLQNQSDQRIYQTQLQTLLSSVETVETAQTQLLRRTLTLPPDAAVSDTALSSNPNVALQQQQVEISRRTTALEKSTLWPDLTLSYFNQSLIGNYVVNGREQFYSGSRRFQGFQVGVALPLWFGPQQARIRAARTQELLAQTNAERYRKQLDGEYRQAWQQYEKFNAALDLYDQNTLALAGLLVRQSQRAYQAGEIGYVEFSQALGRSLTIRSGYLNLLNQYNQAVLTLEFLAGSHL